MATTAKSDDKKKEPTSQVKRTYKKKDDSAKSQAPVKEVKPVVNNVIEPRESVLESTTSTIVESTKSTSGRKEKNVKKPKRLIGDIDKILNILIANVDTLISMDETVTQTKLNRCKKHIQKNVLSIKECNDGLNRYMQSKPSKQSGSGFMKKVPITKELRDFGIKHGGWSENDCSKMSRVDATKAICSHIQKHNLFDEQDKRQIKVSSEIKQLLQIGSGIEFTTYPDIQKRIQMHFLAENATTVS